MINRLREENHQLKLIILRLGRDNNRNAQVTLQQAEEIRYMEQESRIKDRIIDRQADELARMTRERDQAIRERDLMAMERNQAILERSEAIREWNQLIQLVHQTRPSSPGPGHTQSVGQAQRERTAMHSWSDPAPGMDTDGPPFSMVDDPASRVGWQLLQPPSRTGAMIPCTFQSFNPEICFAVPEAPNVPLAGARRPSSKRRRGGD